MCDICACITKSLNNFPLLFSRLHVIVSLLTVIVCYLIKLAVIFDLKNLTHRNTSKIDSVLGKYVHGT